MKKIKVKKVNLPRPASSLERRFLLYWFACHGHDLQREHKFCTTRKWRFDFAHAAARVAIECEGGVYSGGRHTRPLGFISDCEKYNEAALAGWVVFRLAAPQINLQTLARIVQFINERIASAPTP